MGTSSDGCCEADSVVVELPELSWFHCSPTVGLLVTYIGEL